jgi:iron complex outermembrane receptor protein
MARPKTAQPNHSLRKIAVVVATAVSGMSVYAQAAVEPKQEETITVIAAPAAQESAWGPARPSPRNIRRRRPKPIPRLKKHRSLFPWSPAAEMDMKQPKSVKEALSYTPRCLHSRQLYHL